MPTDANNTSVGQGFFDQPTQSYKPGLEPPGFDLLRDFLMRRIFQMGQNPYGLSQQGMQNLGGQQLFSNQLRPQASLGYMGQGQQGQGSNMPAQVNPGFGQGQAGGAQGQLGGFWQDMQRAGAQPSHDGIGLGLPMVGHPGPGTGRPLGYDGGGVSPLSSWRYTGPNGGNQGWGNTLPWNGPTGLGGMPTLGGYTYSGSQHEGSNPEMERSMFAQGVTPDQYRSFLMAGDNQQRQNTFNSRPAGYNAGMYGTSAEQHAPGGRFAGAPAPPAPAPPTQGYNPGSIQQQWLRMNSGNHSSPGTIPGAPATPPRVTPTLPTESPNNPTTVTRQPTMPGPLMT